MVERVISYFQIIFVNVLNCSVVAIFILKYHGFFSVSMTMCFFIQYRIIENESLAAKERYSFIILILKLVFCAYFLVQIHLTCKKSWKENCHTEEEILLFNCIFLYFAFKTVWIFALLYIIMYYHMMSIVALLCFLFLYILYIE